MTAPEHGVGKASLWHRLYHGETTFDFYGKRWRGFTISIVLLLISAGSLLLNGLNLGIDFEGGVAWEVPADDITVETARQVLDANGVDSSEAKVQTLSSSEGERIRLQVGTHSAETVEQVQRALAEEAGVEVGDVSTAAVSASWGETITAKAVRALLVFFVLVSIFIAWRFEWKMALAAFLAMVHDILISVGIYSLFQFEVTPATVIAFLTILGYSLYDTIVVFDRVEENIARFKGSRVPMADIVNVSMNQVLMRSLNTSIASVLPVLSLLVVGSKMLGAVALEEFALALAVGLFVGAYSSIYLATPLLAMMKEREPRYRSLRGAHATGEAMHALSTSGAAALRKEQVRVPSGASADGSATVPAVLDPTTVLTHPPRPRKKRRR